MKKKELLKALERVGDEAEILIATPNLTDIKDGVYTVKRVTDMGTKGTSLYSDKDPFFIVIGDKYNK